MAPASCALNPSNVVNSKAQLRWREPNDHRSPAHQLAPEHIVLNMVESSQPVRLMTLVVSTPYPSILN